MHESERTWRPVLGGRTCFVVMGLVLIAAGVLCLVDGVVSDPSIAPFVLGVFAVAGGVPFLFAYGTNIQLAPDGVTFQNFKHHFVPWRDIADASAGYAGITLRLRDGSKVTAMAVQKSSLSTWTGRNTRADRLVAEIKDHTDQ